jgi:hypothetical protein
MLGRLLVANFHSNKLGEDVTASISVRSRFFAAAKLFDTMLKGLIDADAVVLLDSDDAVRGIASAIVLQDSTRR